MPEFLIDFILLLPHISISILFFAIGITVLVHIFLYIRRTTNEYNSFK